MRILIDECVDPRVKGIFGGHEVATVRDQGWDAREDGFVVVHIPKNQIPCYRAVRQELLVVHIAAPPA